MTWSVIVLYPCLRAKASTLLCTIGFTNDGSRSSFSLASGDQVNFGRARPPFWASRLRSVPFRPPWQRTDSRRTFFSRLSRERWLFAAATGWPP